MTEYISKIQDENTGKIAYFKDAEAREQLNNIANEDLVIKDGKIYIKQADGTLKGTGVTLPTSSSGTGTDGREIELQATTDYIQWRYVGDSTWINLIALSDLKGQKGERGIQGIQGEKGDKGDKGDSAINFEGKKALWLGDSFFAGVTGNTKPSTLLDNKIGTVSTNIAVAGASYISDVDNCITTTFSNYVNSTGIDDFDVILLSGGGNDCFFNENLAIGTFVDTDTLLSDTTVLGQVQRVLNILKEKGKLNNLIYVLGAYNGGNANGLKNIPLLKAKLLPMLDAYGVQYLSLEGKYGLSDTVDSDGMHPTDDTYNSVILPILQEQLLYSLVKSNLKLSVVNNSENNPSVSNISALTQGSLTSNGVKIDVVGKKVTFTAQEDITSAKLFLITGASLLGGTSTSDFASRLTDSFFDCKSGDIVGLELSNVQSTNSNASGWLALASQAGVTQVIVYPQSTTSASATLSATSCGLLCAINNLSAGDTVSYDITVTKNGTEIGNIANEMENIGQPTDEQISTAVNNYLAENPITGKVENYDTQPLGTLFDRPDGWNYVTWCSGALRYDKNINKYINLLWARGGHTDESNGDSQDTIYRAIINADTFEVEELVPIVMLDSDGETDITTDLMEGASFIILEDGTYVYGSYLDDTTNYINDRYTSTDYGKTWVKTPNSRGGGTGYKQTELSNGRILVSNTSKGSGIKYSDDKLITLTQATVDGGYGLAFGSYVAEWEFIELEQGYIMAIGRKNKEGAGSEFSGDSDHALITYSTDYGSTWSKIVESTTIDNMNASNATGIVHDGIVEVFTTSRWYYKGNYTNSDNTRTGKDGAMFHYMATIEDAKNDNFTNLGVVLYANGSNNSAQDFHAPCLAYNSRTKDILIVYMDRIATIPNEENNNYHFVRGCLGKVNTKIKNDLESVSYTFSGKEIANRLSIQKNYMENIITSTKNELLEDILSIKYALSKIEGSEVTEPDVPSGVVLWTKEYNANNDTTLFNDENSPFKNVFNNTSFEMSTDSFGNTVQSLKSYNTHDIITFKPTKNNYAIEIKTTKEGTTAVSDKIALINSSLNICLLNVYITYCNKTINGKVTPWSNTGDSSLRTSPCIDIMKIICFNDEYSISFKEEDNDGNIIFEAEETLTAEQMQESTQSDYTEKGIYFKSAVAHVHSIKIGEWD